MTNSTKHPTICAVVVFYNMQREAKRTLMSLTPYYQRDVLADDYEVIAVENGSTDPLESDLFTSQNNFRYVFFQSKTPSPCRAINKVVAETETEYVMICVDGARILSPGVLKYSIAALGLHEHPFVYTLGMHIGKQPQNYLVAEGYNQDVEDKLLRSINWPKDGYSLFEISSVALSSKNGFFSQLLESNCFSMKTNDFLDLGGFDERFTSPGGGLVNLDFFNAVHEDGRFNPIMLLGEATFHQFHGGVATNVLMNNHPWEGMAQEYHEIKARPFKSSYRTPDYYGWISHQYHSGLIATDQ